VRFVLSFDFLRASQSWYGAVTCTPGALSAYRREAVLPHVDAWLHQTFLGAPCHHSEDRALTNYVLRSGYYSVYQRTAVVHTLVPETYKGLCKMYLRWERGNVRESFVQLCYLFTNYREKHRLLPIVDFFMTQIEFPLTYLFLGLLLGSIVVYPLVLVKFLAALGFISAVYMIYYVVLERDLDFVYGVIYTLLRLLPPPVDLSLLLPDGAQPPLADPLTAGRGAPPRPSRPSSPRLRRPAGGLGQKKRRPPLGGAPLVFLDSGGRGCSGAPSWPPAGR